MLRALWFLSFSLFLLLSSAKAEEKSLIFAASSLKEVLEAAARAFSVKTSQNITFSFAGSGALAKQIEQGAPAVLFISADVRWMDYLAERALIDAASHTRLAGNSLVVVAPADATLPSSVEAFFSLHGDNQFLPLLGTTGRLAIGNPESVPAGAYAKEALINLGFWPHVVDRLAEAENVRMALALVAHGEAPLGLVYKTDALLEKHVVIAAEIPQEAHTPIVYPAALLPDAPPAARAFLDFLKSEDGQAIFRKNGFLPPAP